MNTLGLELVWWSLQATLFASDVERRVVLAHEIAHIARGDYAAWLLAQVSLALHFYHPLVHWLVRRLRLEQELAADVLAAELAVGRELYLVTLTRMVLHQNAQAVGWAARPFLPNRGTFLRRIETLSENPTLRHVAWTRGGTLSLMFAMATLGLAIAGVRVSSGEPITAVQVDERRPTVGDAEKIGDKGPGTPVGKVDAKAAAATEPGTATTPPRAIAPFGDRERDV